MSKCSCEGVCPVCRIGEVSDHKCNRCKAKFCPKCHGIINGIKSENVNPCKCGKPKRLWIFYLNYPNNKRNKLNVLIIEDRRCYGVEKIPSLEQYTLGFFKGGCIFKKLIDVTTTRWRVIFHVRGNHSEITDVISVLSGHSHNFNIKHRSLNINNLGFIKNSPYYRTWIRNDYKKYRTYKRAMDKVIGKIKYE